MKRSQRVASPPTVEVDGRGTAPARRWVLSEKQQRYVERRLMGCRPTLAARLAGYADNGGPAVRVRAHTLERHPAILAAIRDTRDAICLTAIEQFRAGHAVSAKAARMLWCWPGTPARLRGPLLDILLELNRSE